MRKSLQWLPSLLALSLSLLAFTGCGGSDSLVQIQGSSASITKRTLNHWMQAMVSGDFRSSIGTEGPVGLASEPADYKRCDAAVRLIAPKTFLGQVKLSEATISGHCHELYRSVKAQAMSFLISVAWTVDEGAELGMKVSDARLKREFARFRREPYPTEAQLKKYLIERHWVLSDVLYQLKRNILVHAILPKFKAKVDRAGGGEKTYAKYVEARYRRLVARTSCHTGYVAPNCREYHGPETVEPAPDAILEQIVKGPGSDPVTAP